MAVAPGATMDGALAVEDTWDGDMGDARTDENR
jgi:hypothetical protein